jgi:glycine/D-amino acid oxidase-like deaminating enzyme
VLEKAGAVAEGSTGASSAVLRQRYTHDEVVRLARDGVAAYRGWRAFTGLARPRAEFQHAGVLWITGESRERVAADCERLRAHDVAALPLDAAELRERFPALSACARPLELDRDEEHVCAPGGPHLFEPDGGYTDPVGAAQDLAEAIVRDAGELRLRREVTAVRCAGGRVQGVDLDDGTQVDAPLVVNASGPWCNHVNALAGVKLPWTLRPTRVQIVFRERPAELPGPLPVAGDLASRIYFRPESRGQQILVGSTRAEDEQEEVRDPDDFDRGLDPDFRQQKLLGLHHRIPELPHRGRVRGLAGLYTWNEQDVHPVIGPAGPDGWVVANGFSGHGFKLAPMVGSLLARWITRDRVSDDTDVPIDFFAVDRAPIVMQEKTVLA